MKNLLEIIVVLLLLGYGCKADTNNYNIIFDEVINTLEANYFESLRENHDLDSLIAVY